MKQQRKSQRVCLLLREWEKTGQPLDRFLSAYFRAHRFIGASHRRFIAETAFQMVRLWGALDYDVPSPSWETRFDRLQNYPFPSLKKAPKPVQVSFPAWYYEILEKNYGDQTEEICALCNQQAPLTIRVNTRIISRDALYEKWRGQHLITKTAFSPLGITWSKRYPVFSMEEFQQGFFEVQDEGSQLISLFLGAQPGEKILDYCSGSGGKTLAFAPFMEGTGQIYLHDIRIGALVQAKKRLKRAKIQNAQITPPERKAKNRLVGKMDRILLDVPCSGSGTLRRNPETKWRLQKKDLENLITTQKTIFEESLPFAKKGGILVYSTCSLLQEENQEQIAYFCKKHPVKLLQQKQLPLKKGGHDGFFMAAFEVFC
ncbi:MAG: RsmB/NOP family class I SAM-dependent RNA methyltransferase [Chlamydiota bacterium]